MHRLGHIYESNGVEIIDWEKPATVEPPLRKNETVHRYFEECPTESLYPQPFLLNNGLENRTLAVNAAIMTGNNKPENAPWIINLDLPRHSRIRKDASTIFGQ